MQYEKSSWAAAQDFDKKSFSCEEVGSETRSNLTANGTVPAFFNLIATGTLDALYKKITRQNCLDGLPTRLIMGVQPDGKYKMIEYRSRRRKVDDETWLRTVGSRLLELVSDINLEQEVRVPKKSRMSMAKRQASRRLSMSGECARQRSADLATLRQATISAAVFP